MAAGSDGTYTLAVYIPEKVDFFINTSWSLAATLGPEQLSGMVRLRESAGWKKRVQPQGEGSCSKMTFVERLPVQHSRPPVPDLRHLQQAEIDTLLKERGRCQVRHLKAVTCVARKRCAMNPLAHSL